MDENKHAERDRLIVEAKENGRSYREIGAEHGISDERCRQIVKKAQRQAQHDGQ